MQNAGNLILSLALSDQFQLVQDKAESVQTGVRPRFVFVALVAVCPC